MKTIENLIRIHEGEEALIICAGSSVKEYQPMIKNFIRDKEPFTIGVNNITDLFIPKYHLYTNTSRFRTYGYKISNKSEVLLSYGINSKLIKQNLGNREYTIINFTDMKEGVPLGYKKGKIYGFFRTAGCLSIMIAHLMGAKKIYIAGMDGHTFHNFEDVKNGSKQHHCYDENYEPFPKDICIKKDKIVSGVLSNLKEYGINFQILTPTFYSEYYGGF